MNCRTGCSRECGCGPRDPCERPPLKEVENFVIPRRDHFKKLPQKSPITKSHDAQSKFASLGRRLIGIVSLVQIGTVRAVFVVPLAGRSGCVGRRLEQTAAALWEKPAAVVRGRRARSFSDQAKIYSRINPKQPCALLRAGPNRQRCQLPEQRRPWRGELHRSAHALPAKVFPRRERSSQCHA
jgi:hypothetical protein